MLEGAKRRNSGASNASSRASSSANSIKKIGRSASLRDDPNLEKRNNLPQRSATLKVAGPESKKKYQNVMNEMLKKNLVPPEVPKGMDITSTWSMSVTDRCWWRTSWIYHRHKVNNITLSPTSLLPQAAYIDVGDGCWRPNVLVTTLEMLVTDLINWENHQHNETGRQHNDSVTNISNQSPT